MAAFLRLTMQGGQCLALLAGVAILLAPAPAAAAATEPTIAERLMRLERTLASSGLIELVKQVEGLQQEVRQLRGELENQAFTLEQVRKSQSAANADANSRLGVLEQGRGATTGAPADPPLSTLDSPSDVAVAGTPSDQRMAVDIENAAPGPHIGQPLGGAAGAGPPAIAPPPGTAPPSTIAPASGAQGTATPMTVIPSGPAGIAPPPGGMSIAPAAPTIAGVALATLPAPPAPALAPAGPRSDTPESEAAYRDAFTLLKAGQYEQSIAAFTAYLQQYPSSQYADNAQYWVGEAYYVLRQYEPAIAQYQKLIATYPDSLKQSQALLKIGYAYDKLGLAEQAATALTQIKQKFPGSAAARLADEQLQRMRAKSP